VVQDNLVLGKWAIETRTRRVHVQLEPPSLDDHRSDIERLRGNLINQGFQGERLHCSLSVLKKLSRVLRDGDWQLTATLIELSDGVEILDIQPGAKATPFWVDY